ncbi:unnamed protein product [Chilo suppressalis]|uniref:Uncharacterized protein n=1 Tax=Chilo suppressalis TaxID=168631 RepID=A0ABN8B4C6_CHISP|nr:unnamed protein product [Chilo suppressalis]
MMTRKAAVQSTELKLKQALEELKVTKETCRQLLRERDEGEEEIEKNIQRNTQLKSELSQLHSEHMEVILQRDHLNDTVNSFDQQFNTYERALQRITDLEKELIDANNQLAHYKEIQQLQETAHTQSLFEELMASPGAPLTQYQQPIVYENTAVQNCVTGKKKLKKYIRISKFIKRTGKLIKRNNCFHKNIALRKERMDLIDSIDKYSSKLTESRQVYDSDTKKLHLEIQYLHESLQTLSNKYSNAQKQISEHIKSASELVELCNYNAERYESLVKNQLSSSLNQSSLQSTSSEIIEVVNNNSQTVKNFGGSSVCSGSTCKTYNNSPVRSICTTYSTSPFKPVLSENTTRSKTIMFSDKLGCGFGLMLRNYCNERIIGICMPGKSINDIVSELNQYNADSLTNIVIMCGDSSKIRARDMYRNIEVLLNYQSRCKCKIIISAFPYAENLTREQNKRIFNLNLIIYNLLNSHSDNFLYFDINKYISKFKLTTDTMYLAKKYKTQIATLLAFNIQNSVIHGITKSMQLDCFSVSTNKIINLENRVTNSNLN